LLGVAAISMWSAPALALVDQYSCTYESGTDFGDGIEFGYDLDRNSILIQQHHTGAGYNRNFTLGNVRQEGGKLQFDFEFWNNGTVAMRESLSLNFENMIIDAAQYFYNADGSSAGDGQTAIGACSKKPGATNAQDAAVAQPASGAADTPSPTPSDQSAASGSNVVCHTQENGGEGPKSATYCLLSQLPAQKEHSYGPENLAQADGAWCEGEPGQGIGVGIELSFQPHASDGPPPAYDRLLISNGYDKTTKTFIENSRVKQIEIKSDDAFGGQTWVRTLRDETGVQEVLLGGKISPYGILITILDVYPGQKYEDTCLSFVSADFGF
ncbi:MAG: hypothetical protein K8F25_19380, partial [Fimbriimonadaceae bacterium]|nr:hypothetical protein [Alphaproteobacteria bacterium]